MSPGAADRLGSLAAKLEVLASAKEIIDIFSAPFDKQRGETWPEALPQPFELRP